MGEGRLGQSGAQEETAIHHVDSTLGLLVAISVFFASLLYDLGRELAVEGSAIIVIELALLIAFDLLAWVVGVLGQSWSLKIAAWFSTALILLMESLMLALPLVVGFAGVSLPRILIIAVWFMPFLGASLFLWYVVRRAYLDRLPTTPPAKELRDMIDRLSRWGCETGLAIGCLSVLLVAFLLM